MPGAASDQEFVSALTQSVREYLRALDSWEDAYRRYYRLPGYAHQISADMQEVHRSYLKSKSAFEDMVPRGRRLCFRHGLRDSLTGLLAVKLGEYAPQERTASAIGSGERNAASQCLVELAAACRDWEAPVPPVTNARPFDRDEGQRSWLARAKDFFF